MAQRKLSKVDFWNKRIKRDNLILYKCRALEILRKSPFGSSMLCDDDARKLFGVVIWRKSCRWRL